MDRITDQITDQITFTIEDTINAIDTKVLLLIKNKKENQIKKPKLFFYRWTYDGNKFI